VFANGQAIYTSRCKDKKPSIDCFGTGKLIIKWVNYGGTLEYLALGLHLRILIRRLVVDSVQSGAIACRDCVAGKYLATEGNNAATDCVLCGLGKYSSAMGVSVCLDCTSGKFSEVVGALVCTNCAAGKFFNAVGTSVAST
jgi:rubredoxin